MNNEKEHPVAVFNGPIVTTDGLYRIHTISVDEASKLLKNTRYISAIGHSSTAQIISEVLHVDIQMNRIQFKQKVGQKALIFKLNIRPKEGIVLCREEIEKIGYHFQLLERIE